MNATDQIEQAGMPVKQQPLTTSRIVFTEGGKGGVGKTAFSSLLVEWYAQKGAPFTLLDLDTENKNRGSLGHFFRKLERSTSTHPKAWTPLLTSWMKETRW